MRYQFFSETVFLLDIKSEKYYIALGLWHRFPEVGLGLKGLTYYMYIFSGNTQGRTVQAHGPHNI